MKISPLYFYSCFLLLFFSGCNGSGALQQSRVDGISTNDHRIFLTSVSTTGDMDGDPDAFCETVRTNAGLQRTYKAIISSSTENAVDRITDNGGAVYMIDGNGDPVLVANSISALWDAGSTPLVNAVFIDENGDVPSFDPGVFTGSDSTGIKNDGGGDYCADWTSGANAFIRFGSPSLDNGAYLNNGIDGCHTNRRLYCISQ